MWRGATTEERPGRNGHVSVRGRGEGPVAGPSAETCYARSQDSHSFSLITPCTPHQSPWRAPLPTLSTLPTCFKALPTP
eukprot:3881-Chlamydomonas_euryale.AAC.1